MKEKKNPREEKKEGEPIPKTGAERSSPPAAEEKEKETGEFKKAMEEKEKEAKENYERLLRMAADFENYKKRAAREKEDLTKFANEDLIRTVLPFLDNLERAVAHSEKVKDTGVLIEGVRLTIQELLQALNRFGLSTFESVGRPFDPAKHEAILVVPTDQEEPNRVVEEFQKGYFLHDRLLRPAAVSVSKRPEEQTQTAES